jgi:glycosyltransferase involved in cell wall biosynthesis
MRAATAATTPSPHETSTSEPSGRRPGGRHLHLGAHLLTTDPSASDLYLPAIERRRRAAALIDGLSACGARQEVITSPARSWLRWPSSILHVHLEGGHDLPRAALAATAPVTRLVVHLRNSARAPQRSGATATFASRLLGGPTERWLLRRATLVVVNSDRLAEVAREAGARSVLVLPDAPTPAPSDLPIASPRPLPSRQGRRLVSVGPLVARRRCTALVEVLDTLPSDVHLVLIGTGPDRLAIDRVARRLGVAGRVAVLPTASYATVAAHLAHADVAVSASLAGDETPELLLAMAAGRPVVATAIEGVTRHLTAGLDGSLVAPADTAALARSIGRLLADPALAATLGASARRRTRAQGWDVVAGRLLDELGRRGAG